MLIPGDFTEDRLLGGRVVLTQPRQGYRVAVDAVLLAAVTAAKAGERVLDLGTGVGASALCLATRVPGVAVTGLELQPELAALACANAAANDMAARVKIITGDLRNHESMPETRAFDRVMMNPPYLRAGTFVPAPDASKALANGEGAGDADLAAWVGCAATLLQPRGVLTLVQRADRLDEVIALLYRRFGAITLFPLWPKAGSAAKRILVGARLGVATPARLCPGLVLHEADGAFTPAAEAVLRGGCGLDL
ncbi:MAG: methyltransferase [Rhodospirillaceae bacterium]